VRIGVPELVLILIIIVVVLGPTHLPRLGRALGQTVRAFRQGRGMDAAPEATAQADKIEGSMNAAASENRGMVGRAVSSCLRIAQRFTKHK